MLGNLGLKSTTRGKTVLESFFWGGSKLSLGIDLTFSYTGYCCPERLLCKSSNEKRSETCIREQLVTRMVRCGGEIENGDFDKEKDVNVGLFWYVFVVTIQSHWSLKKSWREVPKFEIYSK